MKIYSKYILLFFAFVFFQSSFSQNERIGKITVVKYRESDNKFIMSTTDTTLAILNKRNHSVIISNKQDSLWLKTDLQGIFKIPKKYFDYCRITVNQDYKDLYEEFLFMEGFDKNDTLKLKIHDYHISNKIDSIKAPNFYQNYNTKKAEKDFFNGKKRYLLGIGAEYSKEFIDELERKSIEFGFEIEYPQKMSGILAEHRILYRYNNRMRELLGIKKW
jgi:hypothetical protein